MIAEGLAARALGRLAGDGAALVLPTQQIGESAEHGSFPGTLSHEAETLLAAWSEIGASLARCGVFKLVIVNAHGGQPQIVDLVAKRLRTRHAMLVVRANYMAWPPPPGLVDDDERAHGHHGGLCETSMMLALRPELVRMDEAADFPSRARSLAARRRRFRPWRPAGVRLAGRGPEPPGRRRKRRRRDGGTWARPCSTTSRACSPSSSTTRSTSTGGRTSDAGRKAGPSPSAGSGQALDTVLRATSGRGDFVLCPRPKHLLARVAPRGGAYLKFPRTTLAPPGGNPLG